MAHFQRSITIEAPVHEVFEYWKDPRNWPEVWPSKIEASDVVQTPDGVGSTDNWVYKMAGMRFKGTGEIVACIPDRLIEYQTSGDIDSTFVWAFEPDGEGDELEENITRMRADVTYTVPIPLLGKLLEAFVLKVNEHEAEVTLANLKARMEHRG